MSMTNAMPSVTAVLKQCIFYARDKGQLGTKEHPLHVGELLARELGIPQQIVYKPGIQQVFGIWVIFDLVEGERYHDVLPKSSIFSLARLVHDFHMSKGHVTTSDLLDAHGDMIAAMLEELIELFDPPTQIRLLSHPDLSSLQIAGRIANETNYQRRCFEAVSRLFGEEIHVDNLPDSKTERDKFLSVLAASEKKITAGDLFEALSQFNKDSDEAEIEFIGAMLRAAFHLGMVFQAETRTVQLPQRH